MVSQILDLAKLVLQKVFSQEFGRALVMVWPVLSVWSLVGKGEWIPIVVPIIHSPIPYEAPDSCLFLGEAGLLDVPQFDLDFLVGEPSADVTREWKLHKSKLFKVGQ